MGITVMENFREADTNVLVARGWVLPTTHPTLSIISFVDFVENGITRKALRHRATGYANYFLPFRIPIPATKAFYLSFRLSCSAPPTGTNIGMRFHINFASAYAGIVPAYTVGFVTPVGAQTGKLRFNPYASDIGTGPQLTNGEFYTIEVFRDAAGNTRVWVDDILYYTANWTTTAPADNYISLGWLNTTNQANSNILVGWDIADVVMVDPATAGLQNRPGRSARVLDVPNSADIVTDWSTTSGSPHYQMMNSFKIAPTEADLLTSSTVGAREEYSISTLPAGFGTHIAALMVRPQIKNNAAAVHDVSFEMNFGTGRQEVASRTISPGASYDTTPVVLYKKPDDTLIEASDLTNLKSGFSIKS